MWRAARAATASLHRKFVWSGWLMLVELDALAANVPLRKYTWGLDLAGQMGSAGVSPASSAGPPSPALLEGAGGISGLLAMHDVDDPSDPADPPPDASLPVILPGPLPPRVRTCTLSVQRS